MDLSEASEEQPVPGLCEGETCGRQDAAVHRTDNRKQDSERHKSSANRAHRPRCQVRSDALGRGDCRYRHHSQVGQIGEDIEDHHCGHPDGHRTQQVSLRVPHLACDEADVAPAVVRHQASCHRDAEARERNREVIGCLGEGRRVRSQKRRADEDQYGCNL